MVGTTEEERAGPQEEAGESDERSKETSAEAGGEEDGGDAWGAVCTGGGEVSIAGETLAGGRTGGAEAAPAANWF